MGPTLERTGIRMSMGRGSNIPAPLLQVKKKGGHEGVATNLERMGMGMGMGIRIRTGK